MMLTPNIMYSSFWSNVAFAQIHLSDEEDAKATFTNERSFVA